MPVKRSAFDGREIRDNDVRLSQMTQQPLVRFERLDIIAAYEPIVAASRAECSFEEIPGRLHD